MRSCLKRVIAGVTSSSQRLDRCIRVGEMLRRVPVSDRIGTAVLRRMNADSLLESVMDACGRRPANVELLVLGGQPRVATAFG